MSRDKRVRKPRRTKAYIQSAASQAQVLMPRADLIRLKKLASRVANLNSSDASYSLWWYGVAVTGMTSLVALHATPSVVSRAADFVLWLSTLLGLSVGFVCQKAEKRSSAHRQAAAREILEEIKEFEQTLLPECYDLELVPDLELPPESDTELALRAPPTARGPK